MPSQSELKTVYWYDNYKVLRGTQDVSLTAPMNGGAFDDYNQQGWSIASVSSYVQIDPDPAVPDDPIPYNPLRPIPDVPWWWQDPVITNKPNLTPYYQ